ncbi:PaaX family transcriptional regulator C-terminal domain-containing protein [Streptosporangium vulgare]|uniref:PaaX family transcriptional regulator C-terminal domain-containing protein n=1 Tax=Streptosporangium vulgare TaxID=46190 RepID=UPI0031D68F5B
MHLLEDGDERISSLGKRPGATSTWTLVWHTLPDSRKAERSNFVRQLRFHGFGLLQDGMWASPRDYVAEVTDPGRQAGHLRRRHDLPGLALGGRRLGAAARPTCGSSTRSPSAYRHFAARYAPLTRPPRMSPREAFVTCTEMMQSFRSFADIDPELPEEWATPTRGARGGDRRLLGGAGPAQGAGRGPLPRADPHVRRAGRTRPLRRARRTPAGGSGC